MGKSHSTHTVSRRHSLVREEFMFPVTDLEWTCDWEVYHVEIELKPLTSRAHGPSHVCVDEYTQEILSKEGDCMCACASSKEPKTSCSLSEINKETECGCLQGERGEDCRVERDVYTEDLLLLDNGLIAMNDVETKRSQEVCSVESPHEDAAETNTPRCFETKHPKLQSEQKPRYRHVLKDIQVETDMFLSDTVELFSSVDREHMDAPDCGALTSPVWADQRLSACSLETRSSVVSSTAKTSHDQTSACNGGVRPRRNSCAVPVNRGTTTAINIRSPVSSRTRKTSLKDEPGWIPNPLDSDSDDDDLEDSGVFSDFTGSPSLSASPADCVPATPRTTAKLRALWTGRKRCNSDPVSGTSTSSASSSQPASDGLQLGSGASSRTRPGSSWRLVRFPGKVTKTRKPAAPIQVEDSSEEEDDLSEQLRWLTMSDSQLFQDSESSPEQGEDLHSLETSTNTDTSRAESSEVSDHQSDDASSPRGNGLEGELELDWLCEPEWNNLELELFWSVLRPHLEHLLQPEDSDLLPEACRVVVRTDASDPKMLDRCLLHVQWHIWKGSYSQAVADFRAIRRHFRCCAQSQLIEISGIRDDVENLRLLFQRKRPSRFRLWI